MDNDDAIRVACALQVFPCEPDQTLDSLNSVDSIIRSDRLSYRRRMVSAASADLQYFLSWHQFQGLVHYCDHVSPVLLCTCGALIVWPWSVGTGASWYALGLSFSGTISSRGTL